MIGSAFIRRVRYGAPIIVVSGLPRSGTSMLMQMLEAGGILPLTDEKREADEDNPRGYFELERVKELDKSTDKSWVSNAKGKAIKVISMLLPDLPNSFSYRIIFIERPLSEVIASQNTMLLRSGKTVDQQTDEEIRSFFERHLKKIRIQLRQARNIEVLNLNHRSVLEAPTQAANEIASFLGRKLKIEAMAAAVDGTLYRNRA